MRKCIRCNTDMNIMKYSGPTYNMLMMNLQKMAGAKYGAPHISICPNCGEVSIYFDIPRKA